MIDGWSAVSLWRHHGDLMCSKLKVEVGFLGNCEDLAWLVTMQ